MHAWKRARGSMLRCCFSVRSISSSTRPTLTTALMRVLGLASPPALAACSLLLRFTRPVEVLLLSSA